MSEFYTGDNYEQTHFLMARFFSSVVRDEQTNCWNFIHNKDRDGYGGFRWGTLRLVAHRFLNQYCFGLIPQEKQCLHVCDNPSCVSPFHIKRGTHYDNILDRNIKLRGHSKLTPTDVLEIRKQLEYNIRRTQRKLAIKYNVTESVISRIKSGIRWGNL